MDDPPNQMRRCPPATTRRCLGDHGRDQLLASLHALLGVRSERPGDARVHRRGVPLLVAILIEFYTLWRSLQLTDDNEAEYRITLRWFMASVAVLLVSIVVASLAAAGMIAP